MKHLIVCLMLITSICSAETNIEVPFQEFTIGGSPFSTTREIHYIVDGEAIKTAEIKCQLNDDWMRVVSLYNAEGVLVGSIEQQSHEGGPVNYTRNFILKNKEEQAIGTISLIYSWLDCSFESFDLKGNLLFHSDDWDAYSAEDHFIDTKLSSNKFSVFFQERTTMLERIDLFSDNPELWLHYILIKSLTWKYGDL